VRRSGAREFAFDLETGVGSLLFELGDPVDFAAICSAVREAGFQLLWIEARVRGVLATIADSGGAARPAVLVEGSRQMLALVEGTTAQERSGYARAREAAGQAGRVVVRGRVGVPIGHTPELTVLDLRVEPGAGSFLRNPRKNPGGRRIL
jgi:hypothetical protein